MNMGAKGGNFGGGTGGKGKGKGGKNNADGQKGKAGKPDKKGKAKGKARPDEIPVDDEKNIANLPAPLQEVRRNHGKCKLPLTDVLPYITDFAKDQHGSRFLQTMIDEDENNARIAIFGAVIPHAPMLGCDTFGNFVVQKLFDIMNLEEKKQLAEQFSGHVLSFATDA